MTAHVFLSCPEHPDLLWCDDDHGFAVESVSAARALLAVMHPETAASKVSRIALDCEVDGCRSRVFTRAETVAEARAMVATHDGGWYTARRAGGRIVDGCQWHLGSCCVNHVTRNSPTLDRTAILPGEPGHHAQTAQTDQLDLFAQLGEAA